MNVSVPSVGSKEWLLDPSPWYDYMRNSAPLSFDQENLTWHVFKYADVERVLTQFSEFSSKFRGGYEESGPSSGPPISASMIGTDPPLHTKLRKIVSTAFTPSSVSAMEPRIAEITNELLGSVDSEMDAIVDFAEPLPVTVIAEMLGIPSKDRRKFKIWSDSIVGASETGGMETNLELASYFGSIIEERRKNPGGKDLISAIVTATVDGEKLSDEEVLGFCILLLVAGNETMTNLIGNAIQLFSKYDSFGRLRERPELVPGAIEEVLRFSSPVRAMFRVARVDCELDGKKIAKGQSLMAWIGSANRDEEKFADSGRFDIERKPNPHIAFGHGIHMCIGAPLARLETKVALTSLVRKFPNIALKKKLEELEPQRSMIIRGVKHLPLVLS